MTGKKRLTVFGATGSVGSSTLSLVREHPDKFALHALSANSDYHSLAQLAQEFQPSHVVIADEAFYTPLSELLSGSGITVLAGQKALEEVAAQKVDLLVAAIVGLAGLAPVWRAVETGQNIALANKETLVAAGHLIMPAAEKNSATLLPIDSEHNAIFQCLRYENQADIKNIILTASGGPFRKMSVAEMQDVTIEQALSHPNWSMGPKVTIDSATMMNKGLELIEAYWLFGLKPEQIKAVIHPQSAIHGLVEFCDGSWLAHMGIADMRVPISHALGFPERLAWPTESLDLISLGQLDFKKIDTALYPCFASAYSVIGTNPANAVILNAANEVAVDWFLAGKITFTEISRLVDRALESNINRAMLNCLDDVIALDRETRIFLSAE